MSTAAEFSGDTLVLYHDALRRIAIRRGARAEADDIAQEAITRFLDRCDHLDLDRDPFPWLVRVTINLSRDVRRNHRRVCVIEDDELDALNPATAPSALEEALTHERSETLAEAIRKLKPEQRTLLYLRLVAEMSYEDLADQFEMTVNAMRQRMKRARDTLAALLDEGRRLGLLLAIKLRLGWGRNVPAEAPAAFAAVAVAQVAIPLAMVIGAAPALAGHLADVVHRDGSRATAAVTQARAGETSAATWQRRDVPPPRVTGPDRPATRGDATTTTTKTTPVGPTGAAIEETHEQDGDRGDRGTSGTDTYSVWVGDKEIVITEHGWQNGNDPGLTCRLTCPEDATG